MSINTNKHMKLLFLMPSIPGEQGCYSRCAWARQQNNIILSRQNWEAMISKRGFNSYWIRPECAALLTVELHSYLVHPHCGRALSEGCHSFTPSRAVSAATCVVQAPYSCKNMTEHHRIVRSPCLRIHSPFCYYHYKGAMLPQIVSYTQIFLEHLSSGYNLHWNIF